MACDDVVADLEVGLGPVEERPFDVGAAIERHGDDVRAARIRDRSGDGPLAALVVAQGAPPGCCLSL
jgi:hypothetical protein